MTTEWTTDVANARRAVLPEYTAVERALLRPIRVVALAQPSHKGWQALNQETIAAGNRVAGIFLGDRIEIYRPTFADDPEVRATELRDILRHEFAHALGRNYDEYAPREERGNASPPGWYSRRQITFTTRDGLTVTMPAMDR